MIPFYDIILEAADREGVPFEVAKYLFERESQFDPKAVSPQGAGGIAQLMEGTAKVLGVKNRFDPNEAIPAGIKYLKQGYDKYGSWGQAGGYYHSGPGSMATAKGDITKLGPRGRDYASAFSSRFDKPEYSNYYAPMNLQGRAQLPEVLPTAAPNIMPENYDKGTTKMDDYEQMKIFNPYVQMALGILAGNSGVNKSEAFSNAMQSGMRTNLATQELQRRQAEQRREDAMQKLKMYEYDRMNAARKQTQAWAKEQYESDPKGPMSATFKALMGEADPKTALEIEELKQKSRYYDEMAAYRTQNKGISYALPSKQDVLSAHSMLMEDTEYGAKYKELSTDQQKAIASKYATTAKALADKGDPDPWSSARSVIGTLPEAKLNPIKQFGRDAVNTFKEILGW